jgi:hypothetical protein
MPPPLRLQVAVGHETVFIDQLRSMTGDLLRFQLAGHNITLLQVLMLLPQAAEGSEPPAPLADRCAQDTTRQAALLAAALGLPPHNVTITCAALAGPSTCGTAVPAGLEAFPVTVTILVAASARPREMAAAAQRALWPGAAAPQGQGGSPLALVACGIAPGAVQRAGASSSVPVTASSLLAVSLKVAVSTGEWSVDALGRIRLLASIGSGSTAPAAGAGPIQMQLEEVAASASTAVPLPRNTSGVPPAVVAAVAVCSSLGTLLLTAIAVLAHRHWKPAEARRANKLLSKPVNVLEQPSSGAYTIDAGQLHQTLLSPSPCASLSRLASVVFSNTASAADEACCSHSPEWAAHHVLSQEASQRRQPASCVEAAPTTIIQLDPAAGAD